MPFAITRRELIAAAATLVVADARGAKLPDGVVRTPDPRFAKLPDFPYQPHYAMVADKRYGKLRMHYLDEGPKSGPAILLMHGEPLWAFLYRKMIPGLVKAGHRVIVPDLMGLGRSDKPVDRAAYTYQAHIDWMEALLKAVKLKQTALFCQDWGGLIGLRLVTNNPERFTKVVAGNTGLPTGDNGANLNPAFQNWKRMSQNPQLTAGAVVGGGIRRGPMKPDVVAAYNAPFPDETYMASVRQFPLLVPDAPDNPASEANRKAWKVLEAFTKPFLTTYSDGDPISKAGDAQMQKRIPGCKGQKHVTIKNAGHFLQEDAGEEIAGIVAEFLKA